MSRISTLFAAVFVLTVSAAAKPAAAQKITDERIQQLIREAAARAGVTDVPAPAQVAGAELLAAVAPAGGTRRPARSSRSTSEPRAGANLDIAVQRLNP